MRRWLECAGGLGALLHPSTQVAENFRCRFFSAIPLSMGFVVAFASPKGGVGKSTVAVSAAAELLARGKRVLLVDADPQRSAYAWSEAARSAGNPAPTTVAMGATMHQSGELDALVGQFDVVLIDAPPSQAEILRSAILSADLAVLPATPSGFDLWALADAIDIVRRAGAIKPEFQAAILVNRRDPRSKLDANVRESLGESGLPVLEAMLSNLVAYREAVLTGLGPSTYAPDSKAATEVRKLVDELEAFMQKEESVRAIA